MQVTIDLDDLLLARARDISGITELDALLREALIALIMRQTVLQAAPAAGEERT